MGKDQDLLDAARNGNIVHVGKLLEQIAKRKSAGPLSSFRRSPSINSQDGNGYTPLHHACLNGHSNVVRLLLAHEALVDLPDIRGSTPLYLAAWAGHHDIVKMLLMHRNANPNAQNTDNETPLHCAAQHGHNNALAILLSYGADPTIRNNSFQTALDLAAHFGRLQAVQFLIRTHPELLQPYRTTSTSTFDLSNYLPENYATTTPTKHIFTHTCLHLASRNGHKKVVETLLAAGVNVNILTHAGTALHEAALCGKKSVVLTLLEAGVDPYARDGNGKTALDLLKDYPPHVTYEILTAIKDFCRNLKSERHFQPIDETDDELKTDFIRTIENDMREKSHSIPKSACIKKLNDYNLKSTYSNVKQSNSLNSLEKLTVIPENYLQMRPILWQKQPTREIRNEYEEYLPRSWQNNSLPKTRPPPLNLKPLEYKPNELRNGQQNSSNYRCIDEYVKMTDPNKRNSGADAPKASPRFFQVGDYVNINDLSKPNGSLKKNAVEMNVVTPIYMKLRDANNNRHSPTPDFPPPTVSQAESEILEFIHPPRSLLKKPNKRRSIHIEYSENADDDLESFVMKHINLDEHNEAVCPPAITSTPTSSSRTSDYVEEFVSEVPFAGLFKGSTVNLAYDEVDGFVPPTSRLRSPSLVKSVRPPIPKRSSSITQAAATEVDEDFNSSKVWEEINTILESIGNEMSSEITEELIQNHSSDEQTDNAQTSLLKIATPKAIKIRNPSELLLGMNNDGSTKWCHSPNSLINGQIIYEVFYLGSTVIRELQGTISTRKSIQKLKIGETLFDNDQDNSILENCNTSTKYLKEANQQTRLQVGIAVSHVGVRFIDVTEKSTICIHDIQNINCVCQDSEDLRYFAYITKEQELHYCHVFMVDDLSLATEIILTLGQAFEVAYQLALVKENNSQ